MTSMNFDRFDEIINEMSDAEKNSAEFAMAETIKFGQEYKDTAYMVPFAYINFSLIAESFMQLKHPAFDNRDSKFGTEDFPELDYGTTEEQPSLSTVFAEFLNVMYATILHEHIESLQSKDLIDVTFTDGKFKYELKDDQLKEEYGSVIEYANIFL